MTTTTHVDLDDVLLVADELRRICQKAVKMGVSFSTFKRESWEAALGHVQDLHADRQPRICSDAAFYRLLTAIPARAWTWKHLQPLRAVRVFDGRGEG